MLRPGETTEILRSMKWNSRRRAEEDQARKSEQVAEAVAEAALWESEKAKCGHSNFTTQERMQNRTAAQLGLNAAREALRTRGLRSGRGATTSWSQIVLSLLHKKESHRSAADPTTRPLNCPQDGRMVAVTPRILLMLWRSAGFLGIRRRNLWRCLNPRQYCNSQWTRMPLARMQGTTAAGLQEPAWSCLPAPYKALGTRLAKRSLEVPMHTRVLPTQHGDAGDFMGAS